MTESQTRLRDALADRYQIEREIGRGGMATVYLAADLKHGRKVAIKVMHPETAAAIGPDRFLREIEVVARLTHPHILPLHDSGTAAGQLYFVMPYIGGESLRARIERDRQLPLEDALRLTREIASALGHAHHHGLVHRDIKPENVLLADGIALVADFGLARVMSSPGGRGLTTVGTAVGTPTYMAPEQALGSTEVDGRADVYALGCVLYEMLVGQPPFTGPVESIAYQHVNAAPRPVSEMRPGVPGGVVAAIGKALAKAPADRHATAARFAEALAVASTAAPAATPTPEPRMGVPPNNLPRQRTHFVGRQRELTECARLLAESRLLTLTGIGGCGKTRLALKLADERLASFPDGVWFVDLAPLKDAERVALTMATALGVQEATGTPLVGRIAAHLGNRRDLILLDNCEHVVAAAAELVEALLVACPELKFVVTSREGLGIAGEQVVSLRSLSVPAPSTTDLEAIEGTEAVRLFVDRARLVDPRFRLDATNAPGIAEICRRLDGIPLALELAAVRVKMLSVQEIRSRLGDRFRLLTGGSKAALPRHQTLHATIAWSFDQLSPEEQRLLCQLSVFAGGWTLEGAVRVAGDDADEFEVLDVLTRLADKSLVTPERSGAGTTRYAMLETVRQFAQELLNESSERDGARTRHLAFYLVLAEEARPEFLGPEQGAWLSRFDLERENLLSAHEWCEWAEGGAEMDLRMAYATQLYWAIRGLLELGHRVTVEALSRPGAEPHGLARALALYAAGQLGYLMGRYDEAHGHLEESLSIARAIGDHLRIASALRALGIVSQGQGDASGARRHLEESLALSRELGDKRQLSITVNGLAELERAAGNLDAAEPLCEEFITLERELGNRGNVASGLLNFAMVSIGRGSAGRARGLLLEALSIAEEIGSKRVGQGVLEAASGLAAFTGDARVAARIFGAADALRVQMGLHRDPADEAFLSPLIARARGALEAAEFSAAESSGRSLSYDDATAVARRWLSVNHHLTS
jgi:non-specific serine/threonine protein kinase